MHDNKCFKLDVIVYDIVKETEKKRYIINIENVSYGDKKYRGSKYKRLGWNWN